MKITASPLLLITLARRRPTLYGRTHNAIYTGIAACDDRGNICNAGMVEMLLQNHLGKLHLLPALPSAWKEGQVKGLKARDGIEMTMQLKTGKPSDTTIQSLKDNDCILPTAKPVATGIQVKSMSARDWYIPRFKTQKIKAIRSLFYNF